MFSCVTREPVNPKPKALQVNHVVFVAHDNTNPRKVGCPSPCSATKPFVLIGCLMDLSVRVFTFTCECQNHSRTMTCKDQQEETAAAPVGLALGPSFLDGVAGTKDM